MFKSIFKRNATEYIDTLILLLESWKCGSISGSMWKRIMGKQDSDGLQALHRLMTQPLIYTDNLYQLVV